MPRLNVNGRRLPMPRSRLLRLVLGTLLILLGLVGFLPVLGFWMVPLGLMVLSMDIALIRRFRRRSEVSLLRRWRAWRENRRSADATQPAAPADDSLG